MARKKEKPRRVIRVGSPVIWKGRRGRVIQIDRHNGTRRLYVRLRDGTIARAYGNEAKPFPRRERGVLLKDIPPEEILMFSDGVKEAGFGERDTRELPHAQLGYPKYMSFDQLVVLCRVFRCELGQQQITPGNTDESYRWLALFELAALKKLYSLLGLGRPQSYYRDAVNILRFLPTDETATPSPEPAK